MRKKHGILQDILFTVIVLCLFIGIDVGITRVLGANSLVPAIFTLAVFLISLYTEGYVYGLAASMISMFVVNFAFTFPYLKFNFIITENLVSAVIMLVVVFMTSALTTKLKQQEKVRAEAEKEKMRANLLRAVSHDLRTPLTTIYGSSSAMLENYYELSNEEKIELVQGIKEDAEWMNGMVENLLSVTRIENNQVELKKTQVVLEELIDSVLVRFQKKYPEQAVDIEIPDDFISIPMDAVLITQVLVNMLENAVLHAKGMTKLSLHVHTEEENVVFEVTDNGCGIPESRRKELFTGFFEAKELPVDNKKRSMGIGLSVCASIIKAHDGEIEMKNLPEGGCCFRFKLKMEENPSE